MKRKIFSYQQCLELFQKYYGNNWNPISSFPFSVCRITTFNIWHMYAAVTQKDVSYLAFIDILLFPLNVGVNITWISQFYHFTKYIIYICVLRLKFLPWKYIFIFRKIYYFKITQKRIYIKSQLCQKANTLGGVIFFQ